MAQLVTAAVSIGGQVDLLLLGQGLTEAGEQAAALGGVDKVLLAEHPQLADGLLDGVDKLLASWCQGLQPLPDGGECRGKGVAAAGGGPARGKDAL